MKKFNQVQSKSQVRRAEKRRKKMKLVRKAKNVAATFARSIPEPQNGWFANQFRKGYS